MFGCSVAGGGVATLESEASVRFHRNSQVAVWAATGFAAHHRDRRLTPCDLNLDSTKLLESRVWMSLDAIVWLRESLESLEVIPVFPKIVELTA